MKETERLLTRRSVEIPTLKDVGLEIFEII